MKIGSWGGSLAIRYYDQALVNKIKGWVKDQNLVILSPQESTRLFQMQSDLNNDKPLTLPLIAISRDPNIEIISTTRKSLTYDGGHLDGNEDISKLLNAVPIKLSYQLDIYTRYFAEADEYARNFLFNLINFPRITIEIPYNNSNILHDSTVLVEQRITDNSDIKERLIPGQFSRLTLGLTIDDAYMFSIPFLDNWKLEYDENINLK